MTAGRVRHVPTLDVDAFVDEIGRRSGASDRRYLLGLVGPPGAGKSTLSERLVAELDAVVAPMDGFHLPNERLDVLGRRDRKGAPDTFDADAFVDAATRLRAGVDVAWPAFDRIADAPVPEAIVVPAGAPLVVVEGNYLLLDAAPWTRLVELLDDVAYLVVDDDVRRRRLVDRHVAFGRDRDDAHRFVDESDEVNARLVAATRQRATIGVTLD